MMMKRSLTKSGSTVTSSTSTFVPPYQPMSPLTSVASKQASQETTNVYNILQESKRSNKNTRGQSNSSSANSIGQNSLLQNKSNPSTGSCTNTGLTPSCAQSQIQQSQSSNILNTPYILNSTSKQSESLLQVNQRLLMSAQKTASLHSTNILNNQSSQSSSNNHLNSTSKSPLSHAYRPQTQFTPTSQKTSSSIHSAVGGISPKLLLTGGNKSATMFHSHRPSLATSNTNQSLANFNTNQTNNENISAQKRRDLKPEAPKKTNYNSELPIPLKQQFPSASPSFQNNQLYAIQQSIQGSSNNNYGINNYRSDSSSNSILKDSNLLKNFQSNSTSNVHSNNTNNVHSNSANIIQSNSTNNVISNNINNVFSNNNTNIVQPNNSHCITNNAHNNSMKSIIQDHQQQQQILLTQQQQSKELVTKVQDSHKRQLQSYNMIMDTNSCANLDTSQISNNLNLSNINNLNTTGHNSSANNLNTSVSSVNNINGITSNPMNNTHLQSDNSPNHSTNLHQNYYSNQLLSERDYFSGSRTTKSPKSLSRQNGNESISSKTNLQLIFNTYNQTQNTDIDMQQTTTSDSNNLMNNSNLSANISTVHFTERTITQPDSNIHQQSFQQMPHNYHHLESTQPNDSFPKCSNHPDKKAKYIIYNSQSSSNLYCSKCAVQFSKYGFHPIEISDQASQQQKQSSHILSEKPQEKYISNDQGDVQNQQSPNQDIPLTNPPDANETMAKLKEIEFFLNGINSQGDKWQELNHALLIKKKDVSNFYERQQGRIDAQFNGFIEMINSIKDQTMQKLNENREKSVQIYQNWEKQTKESLTDFLNIKADIEMNTDKIVNFIQMDDFCRIMNSYNDKLAKMTSFFHHIGNECLDLVKFNNQAPPFSQFYSQIEQAFSIVNFSTTLVKKRVSEFMSNKNNSQQLQNNSLSLCQSTQSIFNKEQSLSPNLKSARISTSIIENHTDMSTRGSLGSSQSQIQKFGTHLNKQSGGVSNPQMDIIHEDDDVIDIQSNHLIERQNNNQVDISNNQISDRQNNHIQEGQNKQLNNGVLFQQPSQSTNQSACNSPVKNDNNQRQDMGKKDIYVSFGNNKEASLHKAIQQVKNNNNQNSQNQIHPHHHQLQQQQHQQKQQEYEYNPNNYIDQYSNGISVEQLQATPLQNVGVYIHQIKPLTDIIEHINMNEEDEKSQPNTPELKQIDEIPSKVTPSSNYYVGVIQKNESQQKPFRNLFGGDDENKNASLKQYESNSFNNVGSLLGNERSLSQEKQNNEMLNFNQNANQQAKQSSLMNGQTSVGNGSSKYPTTATTAISTAPITANLTANASQQSLSASNANLNNSLSTSYKYSTQPVSTKSPRYSMYECEENSDNSGAHPLTFPISKNNNQLDDYIQMIEKQNNASSQEDQSSSQQIHHQNTFIDDNSYTYQNYFPSTTNQSNSNRIHFRGSIQNNQFPLIQEKKESSTQNNHHNKQDENALIHQQDDDEVIVTNDKQEELDNPLFSSPGYKN